MKPLRGHLQAFRLAAGGEFADFGDIRLALKADDLAIRIVHFLRRLSIW